MNKVLDKIAENIAISKGLLIIAIALSLLLLLKITLAKESDRTFQDNHRTPIVKMRA